MPIYRNVDTRKIERAEQWVFDTEEQLYTLATQLCEYLTESSTGKFDTCRSDPLHSPPSLRERVRMLRQSVACLRARCNVFLQATQSDFED